MKSKTYFALSSFIFILVGILHLLRLFFKWPVTLGSWQAPLLASVAGALIALILGVSGLRLLDKPIR